MQTRRLAIQAAPSLSRLFVPLTHPVATSQVHSSFSTREDDSERLRNALSRAKTYQDRRDAGQDTLEEELAMPFLPHSPNNQVERQILASIQRGELDNLQGKGQPLPHSHDAQFFRVDPLMSALARSLGAQNIRPESIDARDALLAQLTAFEQKLAEAIRAARGSPAKLQQVQAGHDPGVTYQWEELCKLHRAFNDAVLKDKELYGAAWPLDPYPKLHFATEFDRIAAACQ